MNKITTPFSDLIAGYVTDFDASTDIFKLRTSDEQEFSVQLTPTCYAELVRNLGEAYQDATGSMRDLLSVDHYLNVYGVFYPEGDHGECAFEAKHIVFFGRTSDSYRFESQNWWTEQITKLADFYLFSEFGVESEGDVIDYAQYRTNLSISGSKQTSGRQETDTISRLVYGFASAYLMTGVPRYLEAAEKGCQYLQEHLRFRDDSEGICYWYHAVDITADGREQKIYTSEFGDDYHAIPCYEQIYALAGLTQTYRINGDPSLLADIQATIRLFNRHFKDHSEKGGYYSHIDPITLSPHAESLDQNRARKNWNSVGDHAPAYLINLWLATGNQEYSDFLEYTFDTICEHFPDYEHSPFVQEKFLEDWTRDQQWGWQQNRAVVGHNLKIAWNLTRMFGIKPKAGYKALAEKIGVTIPKVGCDRQRGGWYDVVERVLTAGQKFHRMVWHDRKAWWQQEQGILAYYIMAGIYDDQAEFLKFAREGTAFYNAWFLDNDAGAIYFNVLANGQPYALGTERGKGSHSMAGYHSFELCYLASVYNNLLINQEPIDLFFKPQPGTYTDQPLRVAPDILPEGRAKLDSVWIGGQSYTDFDAQAMTINMPEGQEPLEVRVRIIPAGVFFNADLLENNKNEAHINLSGSLSASGLKYLKEELERAHGCSAVTLDMSQLTDISSEALRYLLFFKQKAGASFKLTIANASPDIQHALEASELNQEISLV